MAVPRSQGRYLKVGNRDGIPLKKRNRAVAQGRHSGTNQRFFLRNGKPPVWH